MPALVLFPISGTYSLQSNTSVQTLVTITPTQSNIIKGAWLDLVNLTQNATITLQHQIDGSNYRTFQTVSWTTGMSDGVFVEGELPINSLFRVQIQSAVAEGAVRSIPYEVWYEGLGLGTVSWTYTLTDSSSGAPIDGATIRITTDSAGTNTIASGLTNAAGQITVELDSGTYYIWRSRSGYNFTDPDTEIVS